LEGDEMAWLKLTLQDGRACLVNTDQVSEIYCNPLDSNAEIRLHDGITIVREGVDEIAAMIEAAERRERAEAIFRAIACNFPHGYDPAEIWDTAWRMLEARDEMEGS
jgi:uncharacterized protein YlzI (FlbEa/FlbD family)